MRKRGEDDDEDYIPGRSQKRSKAKKATKREKVEKVSKATLVGAENLLTGILYRVNGLTFAGYFLGKYLSFRDVLAVAQSCRATHLAVMQSPTFIRHYTSRLLQRYQQHADSILFFSPSTMSTMLINHADEIARMARLPVMASFLKEFPANYLMCDTAVAKNIEAMVAKNKRALVLSVAAEGLDAAARALDDGGLELVETPSFSGGAAGKTGWADNAQVFGSILHEWSRGRGAAKVGMGQWKRGSWMHQVIRFLVHTVDLDSSIWPKYFADIRYREHYRYEVAHDFWILASKLFGPLTKVTKVSFDTHRHLAAELLATDTMEKNHLDEYVDAEQFGEFIRNVKTISGSHGTSAQVFCQGGHMENTVKVVMKHGPLLQSGLLAVFNHDDQGWKIHPGDAWTNWWPAVLKSCQDWRNVAVQ